MHRFGVVALGVTVLVVAGVMAEETVTTPLPSESETASYEGKTVQQWLADLTVDDEAVQDEAAHALIALGPAAYPELLEAARIDNPLRGRMIDAFARRGAPVVPTLFAIARFRACSAFHSGFVEQTLKRMGAVAHPALRRAIFGRDPLVREVAIVALCYADDIASSAAAQTILRDVLLRHPDEAVRMRIMEQIDRWGTLYEQRSALIRPKVAMLEVALDDPSPRIRYLAALRHVDIDGGYDPRVVDTLVEMLEAGVRPYRAAKSLLWFGPLAAPAIPRLLAVVDGIEHAAHAARVLGRIGPEALPGLLERLPSWSTASCVARAIGTINQHWHPFMTDSQVAQICTALLTEARRYQSGFCEAVEALGELGPRAKDSVPMLIALLDDYPHPGCVYQALGRIGPDAVAAVPALEKAVASGSSSAAQALGRLGPTAVPALVAGLEHPDRDVRRWSAESLGAIGHEAAAAAVPALRKVLCDRAVRRTALDAFSEMGPHAAPVIPELIRMLIDGGSPSTRASAVAGLRSIGPKAVPALIAVKDTILARIASPRKGYLGEYYSALLIIGETDALLPALVRDLEQDDMVACWAALSVLEELGPKARPAADAIVGFMKSAPRGNASVVMDLRVVAARAVTRIAPEDGRGTAFLKERLVDSDSRTAMWAAIALAELESADTRAIRVLRSHLDSADPKGAVACAGALLRVPAERKNASRHLRDYLTRRYTQLLAAIALTEAGIADPDAIRIAGVGGISIGVNGLAAVADRSPAAHLLLSEASRHRDRYVRVKARAALATIAE